MELLLCANGGLLVDLLVIAGAVVCIAAGLLVRLMGRLRLAVVMLLLNV